MIFATGPKFKLNSTVYFWDNTYGRVRSAKIVKIVQDISTKQYAYTLEYPNLWGLHVDIANNTTKDFAEDAVYKTELEALDIYYREVYANTLQEKIADIEKLVKSLESKYADQIAKDEEVKVGMICRADAQVSTLYVKNRDIMSELDSLKQEVEVLKKRKEAVKKTVKKTAKKQSKKSVDIAETVKVDDA